MWWICTRVTNDKGMEWIAWCELVGGWRVILFLEIYIFDTFGVWWSFQWFVSSVDPTQHFHGVVIIIHHIRSHSKKRMNKKLMHINDDIIWNVLKRIQKYTIILSVSITVTILYFYLCVPTRAPLPFFSKFDSCIEFIDWNILLLNSFSSV